MGRSVILQCAVSGQSDVDIVWKKEGAILETTEQKKTSRYSVEKKASTQNQTIIQLEIMDADVEDKGVYELVAKNNEGETQSQIVELTAEQVKLSLQAQEEAEAKKAKKKKKKGKTVKKKEVIKPEISSFLKNQIIKEGESLELKCRLDEEIEPDDVTVTWWFNDNEIAESERIDMTFDGTYAKLFLACSEMSDAGVYKCKFQNEQGEDETQGKVQIKPAPKIEEPKEEEPPAEPEPAPPVERKKTYREQQEEEKARKASLEAAAKRESEEKEKKKVGYKPKKKSEVRSSGGDSM